MTTLDVGGRDVLSFTVRGPWAHFRRVDTTTEKLTYRVIPRTTVAGLLAAILGEPRNSYYEAFSEHNSAIAISPKCELETQAIPQLTLPTSKGDMVSPEGFSRKTVIKPEAIATQRKRRTFEYIADPEYRIDVVLEDTDMFNRLVDFLQTGKSTYTPSLGKTECLATINNVSLTTATEGGDTEQIESTVPEEHIVPRSGQPLRMERTPAYMEADDNGRHTTGFASYSFTPGGETLAAPSATVHSVEDRTVCFL